MTKGALLIGLDRAIQVLGPFGSNPNGVPKRLRLPVPFKELIRVEEIRAEERDTPLRVPRDREFVFMGETRAYYIYEEVE